MALRSRQAASALYSTVVSGGKVRSRFPRVGLGFVGNRRPFDRRPEHFREFRSGLLHYSPRSGRQLIATGGVERSGTEPVDSGPNRFLSPRTGATQPRCFCRPLSGACGDLCRLVPGAASRFAGLAPGYRLPPASRAVRPRQRPDALQRVVDEGIAPGWSAHTDFSRSDPVGPRVLDGGHTPRLKMRDVRALQVRDVRALQVRDVRPSGAGCAPFRCGMYAPFRCGMCAATAGGRSRRTGPRTGRQQHRGAGGHRPTTVGPRVLDGGHTPRLKRREE